MAKSENRAFVEIWKDGSLATYQGGNVTSVLDGPLWTITLDRGDGDKIVIQHENRTAGILTALCQACGFRADVGYVPEQSEKGMG